MTRLIPIIVWGLLIVLAGAHTITYPEKPNRFVEVVNGVESNTTGRGSGVDNTTHTVHSTYSPPTLPASSRIGRFHGKAAHHPEVPQSDDALDQEGQFNGSLSLSRYTPFCANYKPASVQQVRWCSNYLRGLDKTMCVVPGTGSSLFCKHGDAYITGKSLTGSIVMSYCADVAIAIEWVADNCQIGQDGLFSEGMATGTAAANGNGDLVVVVKGTPGDT